ncbi:methylamine utilization protein [Litoribrevibacter euphylliae]|uniref:Methylamine utilization protein n=1 Tax=Litoribrevibacter euphylliae TaxID=1834034 RepID=A0ABV7HA05_9GAMM
MNIMLYLRQLLILWVSVMVPCAFALEIKVVDQNGAPVKDAVIAIPEGSITAISPEPAIMDQIDVAFVPHVLAIEQGREVIFPNSDDIRHHVYSFSEPKRFEIKLYKGVPKTPITFDQSGLVALGCNIHDSMLGYIFVSPWPEFKITDTSGLVTLSKAVNTVAVWHPWIPNLTEPMMVELTAQEDVNLFQITLNLNQPQPVKRYKKKYKKRYND